MTEQTKKRDWLSIVLWILGAFFVVGLFIIAYYYLKRKKKPEVAPK